MRDIAEMDLSVRYDPDIDAYRARFDSESVPVSDAVVKVVSEVTDRPPEELESIEEVVDPIVFDALVRRDRRRLQCRFYYADHVVAVGSTGEITVSAPESSSWDDESRLSTDVSVTNEFETALAELIEQARQNDIDIRGGWDCQYRTDDWNYTVEITRLSR